MAEEKPITVNNYHSKSFESFDSLPSRKSHKKLILRSNPVYYTVAQKEHIFSNNFKFFLFSI